MIPEARAATAAALADWANPSSAHADGRRARARLENCRHRIASALRWMGEVVFTSGATEAIEIALTRAACDRRVVSAVEHAAVHRTAPDAVRIPVDAAGRIETEALPRLMAGATRPLVCVQSANSETGVLHPVPAIAERVQAAGGVMLVDCSQSAGKLPLPDADMIVVASHKLGGPPGAGALLLRDPALIAAVGGQEGGYRPGTQNLPAIAGFAAALEADFGWYAAMADLRATLEQRLLDAGAEIVAVGEPRIATIGAYRMPGVPAPAQLMHMDLAGVSVSAGSACSSGAVRPSAALVAMGWPGAEAGEVIRISFGRGTSLANVEACAAAWTALASRRRAT